MNVSDLKRKLIKKFGHLPFAWYFENDENNTYHRCYNCKLGKYNEESIHEVSEAGALLELRELCVECSSLIQSGEGDTAENVTFEDGDTFLDDEAACK